MQYARRTCLIPAIVIAALLAVGCDDDPAVRVYRAPKPPPEPQRAMPDEVPPDVPTDRDEQFAYETPDGWRADPDPGPVRVVSFQFGDDEQTGELAVTRFAGNVGGVVANINRWRGQVGLEPITELDQSQQPAGEIRVDGHVAGLIDLTAPDRSKRIVVVLLPRPGMTWFFKMTGPADLLEEQRDAFDQFIQSVRFESESGE